MATENDEISLLVDLLFNSVVPPSTESQDERRLALSRAMEIAADPQSATDEEREFFRQSKQSRALVRALRREMHLPRSVPARQSGFVIRMADWAKRSFRKGRRQNRWPSPALLAVLSAVLITAGIFVVMILSEARYGRFNERLASLANHNKELEQENESLQQEMASLREQADKAANFEQQTRHLSEKQAALMEDIARLQKREKAPEKAASSSRALPSAPLIIPDVGALMEIGRNVRLILKADEGDAGSTGGSKSITLPPALSEMVREHLRVRTVLTPPERERAAWAAMDEKLAQGARAGARNVRKPVPVPLSPNLTAIRSTVTTFQWKPLPEPCSYQLYVYSLTDHAQGPVVDQGGLKAPQFTLDTGVLKPGQAYFWFVETEVNSQGASLQPLISPSAVFMVIDENSLHEIESVERSFKASALLRAVIYEKYGLYEEALAQVERLDRNNETVKQMRAALLRTLGRE